MPVTGSTLWSMVALAGLCSFFLGLSLLLVVRGRISLVLGGLLSLGGLVTCYALAGSVGGKIASAQYFGCLSLALVVLQMCFWRVPSSNFIL